MTNDIRGSAWIDYNRDIHRNQTWNQYQTGQGTGNAAKGQAILDGFMPTNVHESRDQRRAEAKQLRDLMREVAAERNARAMRQSH